MGIEQYSRYLDGATYIFALPLYEEHRSQRCGDRNLNAQGFLHALWTSRFEAGPSLPVERIPANPVRFMPFTNQPHG